MLTMTAVGGVGWGLLKLTRYVPSSAVVHSVRPDS